MQWMRHISSGPLRAATICALYLTAMIAPCQTKQDEYQQHIEQAVQAQSSGNLKTAISEYESALAIQSTIPEIWANLGLMQHQASDYSSALASFAAAHRLQPKLFVPTLFLGLENLELDHPSEAVAYLLAARQLNPKDPNVHVYLGRAYFKLKRFEDSASSYSEATKLNPANGEAWYRLGIAYLEVAESNSSALYTLNRHSPYFQALEADSSARQDKLDRAIIAYRSALTSKAPPPCVRSSLGIALLREGRFSEARAELQQDSQAGGCSLAELGLVRLAFAIDPANTTLTQLSTLWKLDPNFVLNHASVLVTGLTPEQLVDFDAAFARTAFPGLTPEDVRNIQASVHGVLPVLVEDNSVSRPTAVAGVSTTDLYKRGEYGACTARFSTVHAAPTREKLSTLAACSYFTGEFTTTLSTATKLRRIHEAEDEGLYWSIRASQALAVVCLVRAGEAEPNSIRIHNLLAESYRDMGKYGAAETEYTASLSLNSKDFTALLGAAANYLQENRIELASAMIQQALEQNPSDPEANYIAGEVLTDQRRFDESEPHLKLGLHAKAELVSRIHALLGRVYASRGEDVRAIEELKLGLPSDDDGSIHFQLARLYQKTGQQKLADAAFEETKRIKNSR
jgi:tetratricopeptide (TPR) repeat protein